jgi:prepilin-type N-terminal cleavage/methylation domain-containing protein
MSSAKLQTRPRRGFTLVEAIAALVLLGVTVPPLMMALSTASLRRGDAVLASRARWIASEGLEQVIADRYSAARGYAWVVNANYPAESTLAGRPGFARTTTITEVAADLTTAQTGTGIKLATTTVSYTTSRRVTASFSMSTVLTNY